MDAISQSHVQSQPTSTHVVQLLKDLQPHREAIQRQALHCWRDCLWCKAANWPWSLWVSVLGYSPCKQSSTLCQVLSCGPSYMYVSSGEVVPNQFEYQFKHTSYNEQAHPSNQDIVGGHYTTCWTCRQWKSLLQPLQYRCLGIHIAASGGETFLQNSLRYEGFVTGGFNTQISSFCGGNSIQKHVFWKKRLIKLKSFWRVHDNFRQL